MGEANFPPFFPLLPETTLHSSADIVARSAVGIDTLDPHMYTYLHVLGWGYTSLHPLNMEAARQRWRLHSRFITRKGNLKKDVF